jgi:hypothetical protein
VDWDTIDFASMDDSYTKDETESNEAEPIVDESFDEGSKFLDYRETEETKNDGVPYNSSPVESNGATIKSISVKINGNSYTLSGKKDYIFVDIFNVYPFDTNQSNGRAVYTLINSNPCGYVDQIKDGDSVEIGWKEN